MKTIVPIFCTALIFFLLMGCNEEKKEEKTAPEVVQKTVEQPLPTRMYVIAPSGLLLRKDDHLDSEQIGKMAYGTRVEVLSRPDNQSIEVANMMGHMIKIKYNGMTGYAYDGYLTRFSVPQNKETPESYTNRLKQDFPKVSAGTKTQGGNNSSTTTSIVIPTASWSEAFLIAKQLYTIPSEYIFPGLSGPDASSVQSHQEHAFSSTLEAERAANTLTRIIYTEKATGFSRKVTISQNDDLFTLAQSKTTN